MEPIKQTHAGQNAELSTGNNQTQRAFLGKGKDTVEIKSNNKLKKVAIGTAIWGAVVSGLSLAYMIGRNPAKAAKVLRGNDHIVNKAYEEGKKVAQELIDKKGDYKTSFDDVLKLFKKPEHRCDFEEKLEELDKYIAEKGLPEDSEIPQAVKTIRKRLDKHFEKIEEDLKKGVKRKTDASKEFADANREEIETIYKGLGDADWEFQSKFSTFSNTYSFHLRDHIKDCPQDILPNDGVFFHGTKKGNAIYKSGFTPYASKQLSSSGRELGAGIYTTPDARVAASFSGLEGSIIPVKLDSDAKIALVSEDAHRFIHQGLSQFYVERLGKEGLEKMDSEVKSAMVECLMQQAFKSAGYDAAYIPKGVKAGGGLFGGLFTPDINEVIGTNQKQLVIFSPEKIEIVPRMFKERLSDLKDKFDGLRAMMKYHKEHPFGF